MTSELDPLTLFLEDDSSSGRTSIAADVIGQFCEGAIGKLLEDGGLGEQAPSAWVHDRRLGIYDPSSTAAQETSGGISSPELLEWLKKQVS
jgi:hypothetical protein